MKIKKILFIITCLIILLVPNIALAAETFTYGDYTYTIEKAKLKKDTLPEDAVFINMNEEGYYIFHSGKNDEFYKVNEKECIKMEGKEIFEFNNKNYDIHYMLENEYDIYEEKVMYSYRMGFTKTNDTEINPNTTYWLAKEEDVNGEIMTLFEPVPNPEKSKLDQYCEEINLRYPTSTEIEDTVTYYQINNITKIFEKVENPTSENFWKYFIEVDDVNDFIVKKKVGTLNKTAFEKIFENYYFWGVQKDQVTNELIVLVTNGRDMAIYDTEGLLIGEFKEHDPIEFSLYSNSLYGIKDEDGPFKILDKNMNVIFESENLPLLHERNYKDNTYYLVEYHGSGTIELYTMTANKNITDEDNTDTDSGNIDKNEENLPSDGNTNKEDKVNSSNNENNAQKPSEDEKDDTPKTGNNIPIMENKLFIALILISIFCIIKLKIK